VRTCGLGLAIIIPQSPGKKLRGGLVFSSEDMRALLFPLLAVGSLASYVAGLGVQAHSNGQALAVPPALLSQVVSAALHTAWMVSTGNRRTPAVAAACWLVSLWLCWQGALAVSPASPAFVGALLLEGIPLILALALSPRSTWAERLARWRRARADISAQLQMGQGVLPWARESVVRFVAGAPDRPAGADYSRFLAEMADAEHRLRIRLSRLALPEQLRQSILASAAVLLGRAETSAAHLAIELEQQALSAAAAYRDQCEQLPELTPKQRQHLAHQCESLFVELIRPAAGSNGRSM
jgi:hypothetical protein